MIGALDGGAVVSWALRRDREGESVASKSKRLPGLVIFISRGLPAGIDIF